LEHTYDVPGTGGQKCKKINTTPDQEKDMKAKINTFKKSPGYWCLAPVPCLGATVSHNCYTWAKEILDAIKPINK
jgi:hypothetical protein